MRPPQNIRFECYEIYFFLCLKRNHQRWGLVPQVPQAGWYEVDILWFQRLVTSCLNMRWGPAGGQVKWVPDAQFGYK